MKWRRTLRKLKRKDKMSSCAKEEGTEETLGMFPNPYTEEKSQDAELLWEKCIQAFMGN